MSKASVFDTVQELHRIIRHHDKLYYALADPVISDRLYDILLKELRRLEEEYPEFVLPYSPTQTVASDRIEDYE